MTTANSSGTSTNLMQAHHQWANRPADQRFESLAQLTDAVKQRRMRSRSVDIDLGSMEARQDGERLVLNRGTEHSLEPTHWSFGQLAGWIHAPAGYLRELPDSLTVPLINHGIKASAKERGALKFMAVLNPESKLHTLQAVTSTTYGRIWDADVAEAANRIQERTGGRFYNPKAYDTATGQAKPSGLYASDRDIFIFMIDGGSLLDIGPRAQLNRGFFMWNSETGSRTFGLTTFLFNVVCGNHIVWGASDVRQITIRHTQNGPYRFDSEAAPALLAYANSSQGAEAATIKAAMDYLLPTASDLIDWQPVKALKFTKTDISEAISYAKREEGDCRTLWQLVQGLTAYARGFDWIDAKVELETKAGKLLNVVVKDGKPTVNGGQCVVIDV